MNSSLEVALPKEIFHLPLIGDLKNKGGLVNTAPDLMYLWIVFSLVSLIRWRPKSNSVIHHMRFNHLKCTDWTL